MPQTARVCRNIAGEEKATHAHKITDAKTGGFKKDRNKSFKVCNYYISNNDFFLSLTFLFQTLIG